MYFASLTKSTVFLKQRPPPDYSKNKGAVHKTKKPLKWWGFLFASALNKDLNLVY
jgi:hypothetical protein